MIDLRVIIVMFLSMSGGLMVSGGVFAFITIIGVVPSIANKTKTEKYLKFFEECIIFGGILGCCSTFIDYNFNFENIIFKNIIVIIYFTCVGIFYGILAASLAETLDVIPVLSRRVNIKNNIYLLIIVIGIGKLLGSILFYTITGFESK